MTTAPVPTPRPPADETLRSALAVRARPRRPNALSASLTHGWRTLTKFRNSPAQLIDIVLMPVVFLLMFTYLFGGAFAGSTREYLQFFLPGILVMTVVLMTVYTGTALNTDITKGIFDRFRTLPFWQPATIVGNLLGDVVRYTIALTITTGLGLLLGFRPAAGVTGVLLTMLLLILFGFSVGWIFAALGVVVRSPESVSGTSMIVMFPLIFTSNVFVQTATMPGWMQAVVSVNPVSHATTAARGLMHGTATAGQLGLVLATCAALIAVFAPLTMYLYRNKNQR
ncbi:ABC transporter permease [Marinitenerispora sediminis]|uniref:Transport permease protein n=1 Tax=Marinitenerispora sediminis TaxID=1931232 RepID=A0A368SZL4_9ACTN|nr:ABC transporter permease [Marinitenerispora sediminis]RCV48051.1 ABC transporter [Marinitenerispora sediminis]RCV49136.1 ABC transporter [Marinitenerispora sediminis]RCV51329.1 ABC transporter [Marinitenerispora sediminis]